ncbi:hypothetical protein [Stutzerimonas xanthomarina]|uniref:hypothetical protein n=1 Tax=Stutzerimonas xanthomarina TaxID=271420 RepID=UPI003AA85A7D
MTCVACGYQPTDKERAEQPYACPRCEPESWRPSLAQATKDCFKSLVKAALGSQLSSGIADRKRFATGFADAMDDLEAMNDPRNTAQSIAAAHEQRRASPGLVRTLFGWVGSLWPAKKESKDGPAKRDMTPQEEAAQLSEAVTHALDQVETVVHAYQQSRSPVTASTPESPPETSAQTASKAS